MTSSPIQDGSISSSADNNVSLDLLNNSAERVMSFAEEFGPNKHDQAAAAIGAIICEGFDTSTSIIENVTRLGFNRQHVALVLKKNCGSDPKRHPWSRDKGGRYHLN